MKEDEIKKELEDEFDLREKALTIDIRLKNNERADYLIEQCKTCKELFFVGGNYSSTHCHLIDISKSYKKKELIKKSKCKGYEFKRHTDICEHTQIIRRAMGWWISLHNYGHYPYIDNYWAYYSEAKQYISGPIMKTTYFHPEYSPEDTEIIKEWLIKKGYILEYTLSKKISTVKIYRTQKNIFIGEHESFCKAFLIATVKAIQKTTDSTQIKHK